MVGAAGSAGSSVLLSGGAVGASYRISIYPGDPFLLAGYLCRSNSLHISGGRTGSEAGILEGHGSTVAIVTLNRRAIMRRVDALTGILPIPQALFDKENREYRK